MGFEKPDYKLVLSFYTGHVFVMQMKWRLKPTEQSVIYLVLLFYCFANASAANGAVEAFVRASGY